MSEPQRMTYGGTDAVFEDGCGNLLNLHQHWRGRRPRLIELRLAVPPLAATS